MSLSEKGSRMTEQDIKMKTGLRIKELRAKTGLSQESFAWGIGMARTYFAEVETGERNMSLVNLERIADGLGVTLTEFFDSELFDK